MMVDQFIVFRAADVEPAVLAAADAADALDDDIASRFEVGTLPRWTEPLMTAPSLR